MSKQQKPVIPTTTSNVVKSKRGNQLFLYKSYKFPLFPDAEQEQEFRRIYGANRWLRNHFIKWDDMEYFHNEAAGFIGYNNGFQNELTPLRNDNVKWLATVSRPSQRKVADDLVDSYTAYFKGDKNKPKLKGKKKEKPAFTLENGNFNNQDGKPEKKERTKLTGDGTIRVNRIDSKNREINLPAVGWTKIRLTREFPEGVQIMNVGISCKNGQWYAAVLFRTTDLPSFNNESIIGVDLGARSSEKGGNSIVLSNGIVFKLPSLIEVLEKQIERKQQDWERKKRVNKEKWKAAKGHGVRRKIVVKKKLRGQDKHKLVKKTVECPPTEAMNKLQDEIRDLYKKITDIRDNFLHHVSSWIADRYDWVVIENLNTKGMTKSNKGTKKKPGKNRAANKAKNRGILRQGWGKFKHMLGYKMRVIAVHPANTSIQCCLCPRKDTAARKGEVYECTSPTCSNKSHADWNAAINVLEKGLNLMQDEGVVAPPRAKADITRWKKELNLNLTEVKLV